MDAARFHNALRIMMNLDRHHLVDVEVIRADDEGAWRAFRDYPHEASLHLNDASFERLFALIESRQPKPDAAPSYEIAAKAALFFDHIEGARGAGKDWWAKTLIHLLKDKVEGSRLVNELATAVRMLLDEVPEGCAAVEAGRAVIAKAEGRSS